MSCANTRSFSYSYHQPLPPMARSTERRRQCVTRSHSFTSRKHSTMAASLNPQIGQLGKDRNPTRWFRREGMERVVSAIVCLSFGIDLDGEAGTRHCVRSSCRPRPQSTYSSSTFIYSSLFGNMQPTTAPSPLTNRQANKPLSPRIYYKNARRRS